ncbi:MAG TPA: NADP-dependent oxidoreductase [Polyangia bacterium]|nr:NADP-dependent oxidoreductase [Polyangia bacterium]
MKAVVLTAYGEADKFEVRDLPDPAPGASEILVRMAGASINPIDWKLRSGAYHAYMPLQLPTVLGNDASGEVIAVGSGVTAFKVGQRVLGRAKATYAQLIVAPTENWALVPAKMDVTDAGALPVVVLTGAQLIEEAVDAREGATVLITGATGSVGRVAVFAARARGARVYAGVRGVHKTEAAKLGAAGVVALDDDGDVDRLPQLDAIADTVGGDTIKKLLGKVKPGGVIGSVVGEPAGAKERGLTVRSIVAHHDSLRLAQLAAAVADGKLIVPIAKRFPLAQAREAHRFAEKGAGGKVLLIG